MSTKFLYKNRWFTTSTVLAPSVPRRPYRTAVWHPRVPGAVLPQLLGQMFEGHGLDQPPAFLITREISYNVVPSFLPAKPPEKCTRRHSNNSIPFSEVTVDAACDEIFVVIFATTSDRFSVIDLKYNPVLRTSAAVNALVPVFLQHFESTASGDRLSSRLLGG
jgi:hypothetical protein